MRCVFCQMLARKAVQVSHPLMVSLAKDPQGRAYFHVEVPMCEKHDGMPGILDRTLGEDDRPEVRLYDEAAGSLFDKTGED